MKTFLKILAVVFVVMVLDILRYFITPDVASIKRENPETTAFMEYRKTQWADEGKDVKLDQRWVSLSQISPNLIKAVLIGEDDGFYKHDGFDVKGMENAIERSIKKGTLAGGSTISQQLSKNLYLSPSKNPVRKLKEAIITYRLEKTLSKRRILEIYLNIAEWGDGIFGIEAAARHYYGKSAKSLNAKEAAHLASVLPNPIKYNPLSDQKYVVNRSNIIYKILLRRGVVIQSFKEVMAPPKADEIPVNSNVQEENVTQEPEQQPAQESEQNSDQAQEAAEPQKSEPQTPEQ
jgi:monofunctional biosynthetic peptidoglycan transglycosylase